MIDKSIVLWIKITPKPEFFKDAQEAILEVTQIGKECHAACAIRQQVGDCIMPREGIFAKVIHSGRVKAGDTIKIAEK